MMSTHIQPDRRATLRLSIIAIVVVFGCVGIRALAPGGWAMFFLAIPYFVILYTHAYIHTLYAKLARFSKQQYMIVAISHLLLIIGALFQWDFTDTRFTWAPITELLPIAPITTSAHGWQLIIDLLALLPTIASWLWLWSDRKQRLRAAPNTHQIRE